MSHASITIANTGPRRPAHASICANAAIRADLKLPTRAQHDAFEDVLGVAEMYLVLEDMRERSVRLPRQRSDLPGAFSIA